METSLIMPKMSQTGDDLIFTDGSKLRCAAIVSYNQLGLGLYIS